MLRRLIDVRGNEILPVVWSFVYGFSVLSAYMILRPVRDAIAAPVNEIVPWLLTAVFLVMLALVPLFGWVSARLRLRDLLPAVYTFFILHLAGFYAAFELIGMEIVVAGIFYVWVSVFNVFIVSVFWSFMVDLWTEEQGKRLFGLIALGVQCGAIAGPALTGGLVKFLGVSGMLWVSAAFLVLGVFCIWRLTIWARQQAERATPSVQPDAPLGGSIWAGLRDTFRSPYLLAICGYILCYTTLGTLLYLEQLRLVNEAYPAKEKAADRTALFAWIDLTISISTVVIQSLVTGPFLARFGLTWVLVLMPAATFAGFIVLGASPTLAVLILLFIVFRVGEFSLSKPGREILFTVVSREEKYKAKNVIDTLIYRGGDTAASWLVKGLRSLGLGLSALSFLAMPLAAVWFAVALWLGSAHRRPRLPASTGSHAPVDLPGASAITSPPTHHSVESREKP
jgi:AAA family ATP:ADP antiporter